MLAMNRIAVAGLALLLGGTAGMLVERSRDRYPAIMTKRWAVGSALSGETFEWARFETPAHCEIVGRHLNAAKASQQFGDDFGYGDYTFECER